MLLVLLPSPVYAAGIGTTTPSVDSIIASTTKIYDRYSPAFIKKVIDCEGHFYKNAGWNGHQNYDRSHSKDWGPLQVNDHWHKAEMDKLHMDIYNWQDSLVFGIIMMNKQGTKPWNPSKYCWSK